ncbi:hypothetical protein EG329_001992 [Mollisiaceae sp. DMI_Dod_QoI]|nr:hypothetical protein EG329_001992 [Helotiales sp. DMI_Dod_QoI]
MANESAISGGPSGSQWMPLWVPYIVSAILAYAILCSTLRYQRRDAMHKKFKFSDRKSYSRMTNVEAQAIFTYLGELEFPKIMETSSPETASKRYADTSLLITEFLSHHPQSERAIKAIARMNYIHSRYQKAGKISNDDLLYTLSVFITEPITWVEKYEWRPMTEMEMCAIATFWKSIGDSMGIGYGAQLARSEWVDGLEFYEDIKNWAEAYEIRYMVPAQSNKTTADELVPLLLFYVPAPLKTAASHIVSVLMGNRLRAAMSFPNPPAFYVNFAYIVFETRRFYLRHFSLPRPSFMRVRDIGDIPDPKTGRYHLKQYLAHPYYNKPGFLNRWGPEAWFVWYMGGDVPGSKGSQYIPEGYKFEEIGPSAMKNQGTKETKAWEEKLKAERPTGCPFRIAR